jgi:hypothetical protein
MKNTRKKLRVRNKTRKNKDKQRVFTRKDYMSGDGFLTSVWGPAMWHFLHTMSFNYPINPSEEDKENYKNFVLSLQKVLPCKYCRMNLEKNFKKLPITDNVMKDRETFSRYIFNLHELINKMLGKNSGLSYCEVRERYEHFRSRCTVEEKKKKEEEHKSKKEKGCTIPLHGKKAKCVIKIVPQEEKCETFQMDERCVKKK